MLSSIQTEMWKESLRYVLEADDHSNPVTTEPVPRTYRNSIHVHYLPGRRDPTEQITYTATSLLGRALRSANWESQKRSSGAHTKKMSATLAMNAAVAGLSDSIMGVLNGIDGKFR